MSVWVVTNNKDDNLKVFEDRDNAVNYLIGYIKETTADDDEKWRLFISFYDLYMLGEDDFTIHFPNEDTLYVRKKEVIKAVYPL